MTTLIVVHSTNFEDQPNHVVGLQVVQTIEQAHDHVSRCMTADGVVGHIVHENVHEKRQNGTVIYFWSTVNGFYELWEC